MSIRILHAADLHMDQPFDGLPDEAAAALRSEMRRLPEKLVEQAVAGKAQVLVLAGDLLDSDSVYTETFDCLRRALAGCPVPVFIAPGNHDHLGGASLYSRGELPEGVHVFSDRPECVELPELRLRVWGMGFTDSRSPALLGRFRAQKREGWTDLLVIHGDPTSPDSAYNPVTREEIAASGMDYIAFGHIHSFSGLRRSGGSFYAWPGCTAGRGFDECGEKGVILADIGPGEASIRFLPVEGRRYGVVTVDLTDCADEAEAVAAALPKELAGGVCRLILEGETAAAPDLDGLRRRFEGGFLSLHIRDRTRIRRDIWAQAGGDSLRGLFLGRLKEMYDRAGTPAERDRVTRAARYGLRALDGEEELPW